MSTILLKNLQQLTVNETVQNLRLGGIQDDGLDAAIVITPEKVANIKSGNINLGNASGSTAVEFTNGLFKRIIFDNLYNDSVKGPNRITLFNDGSWIGGFGVHNDTLANYSGTTFKWYKSTNASSYTQTLSLDGSGNLIATANVTAYSDERLKSNIKTIENSLNKVLQLRGVSYEKDGCAGIGVIAQEVQKVLPEVVLEGTDENKTLSVAYGNIVGLLIEAIKDQQKQIEELKIKLEER